MKAINPSFSIAEYCGQMDRGEIVVNREYQRSPAVWPPAARSYLIETILLGFPIPKLTLYQKTDPRTKTIVKEIVDGQQRSLAICDYFHDKLRLSGHSEFAGKLFSQLDEAAQLQFIEYPLGADLLLAATPSDIRQLFRRINSYTVPLNPAESRHAIYQGAFKWFVVGLSEKYSQLLKDLGVFTEAQLTRLADAVFFSEFILALREGIQTSAPTKLDALYRDLDNGYGDASEIEARFEALFDRLIGWDTLHQGVLMKPYNFYSLALAISHAQAPVRTLENDCELAGPVDLDRDSVLLNLSTLASAVADPETHVVLADFVRAGSAATNTEISRRTRFRWFCRALAAPTLR
jgi:hypothetical protein